MDGNHRCGVRPHAHTARAAAMGERYDHAHAVWVLANSVGCRAASAEAGPAG